MNMTYKKFRARYFVVVMASLGCWFLLVSRIFFIQMVDSHSMGAAIAGQFEKELEIPPLRGNFYDRNGNIVDMEFNQLLVSRWEGDTISIDNKGNSVNEEGSAYREYIIINVTGQGGIRYAITDSGSSGFDELIVNGTPQPDVFTLNAAGQGAYRTGTIASSKI